MASNVRMKITAGVTALGLGGLAGYALGSNDGEAASFAATTPGKLPASDVRPIGGAAAVVAGSDGGTLGSVPAATLPRAVVAAVNDAQGCSVPSTGASGASSSLDDRGDCERDGDDRDDSEGDDD